MPRPNEVFEAKATIFVFEGWPGWVDLDHRAYFTRHKLLNWNACRTAIRPQAANSIRDSIYKVFVAGQSEDFVILACIVLIGCRVWQTDRRTDGRTPRRN